MNGVLFVMCWLVATYSRYEYIDWWLQNAGCEEKKYDFENVVHFPFGVGKEGFGSSEDRQGNPVDRD